MDMQHLDPDVSRTARGKAVGVAGVFLLLGGLACLALVLAWVNLFADRFAIRAAADAYLHDVFAGRTESAYRRTTEQFQLEQSPGEFHHMVGKSPVLRRRISWSWDLVTVHKDPDTLRGVVVVTMHSLEHPLSLTLVLVKENGDWRIDKWYDGWE
jgi:hypothetical protein